MNEDYDDVRAAIEALRPSHRVSGAAEALQIEEHFLELGDEPRARVMAAMAGLYAGTGGMDFDPLRRAAAEAGPQVRRVLAAWMAQTRDDYVRIAAVHAALAALMAATDDDTRSVLSGLDFDPDLGP